MIETSGDGTLTGVWVDEADHGDPDVAFIDEIDELMAEKHLGEVAASMEADGTLTWRSFLVDLHRRQNLITVQRFWIDAWTGTAPELLAAAAAAQAAGLSLSTVS